MWAWTLICLLTVLISGFYLIGFTISLPFSKRLHLFGAENFSFAILISIALITFIAGWCSYIGFSQNLAAKIILALFFLTALIFSSKYKTISSHVITKSNIGLFSVFFIFAIFSMLSIFLYHGFNPYNDTFGYVSIADYLRYHSYFEKLNDISYQPILAEIYKAHGSYFRMGAMFFLALIASIFHVAKSLLIYPAVAALGGILNIAAIYFYISRVIEVKRISKYFFLLLIVLLYSPLYFATSTGFFSQLFGTAFFVLSMAFLELQLADEQPGNWFYWGFFFGLSSAAVVSFYTEISPAVFLTLFLYLFLQWALKLKKFREIIKYGLLNLMVFSLFANIELYRAYHTIQIQFHAVGGWNINFNTYQFLGMAFGVQPVFNSVVGWFQHVLYFLLLIIMILLLIVGAFKSIKIKKFTWVIPVIIFTIMAICYNFVPNPFLPGQLGQTWDIFKLCNWVFPFIVIGLTIGFNSINKFLKPIFVIISILLITWTVPIQLQFAAYNANPSITLTNSSTPFQAYEQYRELAEYLYGRTNQAPIQLNISDPKKRQFLAYFLYPLPIYGNFKNDGYIWPASNPKQPSEYLSEPYLTISDISSGSLQNILPAAVQYTISKNFLVIQPVDGCYGQENSGNLSWTWCSNNGSFSISSNLNDYKTINISFSPAQTPLKLAIMLNGKKIKNINCNINRIYSFEFPISIMKGTNVLVLQTNTAPIHIGADPRLLGFRLFNLNIVN